ncbi:MAG: hypothetical protein J6J60_09835 [Clostridia bacterium]|nr:hypothetical protein [Clostridia bacterium]
MKEKLLRTLAIITIIALIIIAFVLFIRDPLLIPKLVAILFSFLLSLGILIISFVKLLDLDLKPFLLLLLLAIIILNGGLYLISEWF